MRCVPMSEFLRVVSRFAVVGLVGGMAAVQLIRNINLPSSLFALTSESTHTLYASNDGGITWQLVTTNPSPAADQLATVIQHTLPKLPKARTLVP